jgi:simple sugar transport system ATP-binding protein
MSHDRYALIATLLLELGHEALAQPTRGLDVGAYRYVHQQLTELRASGAGVLLISEDLDELRALSDRIVVLLGGRLVGEVSAADANNDRLGLLMTGQEVA